jgi:hypothetical protein
MNLNNSELVLVKILLTHLSHVLDVHVPSLLLIKHLEDGPENVKIVIPVLGQ